MFKYPSRPFIYLVMCLNITSVVYIIQVFSGHDSIVCQKSSSDVTYFIPDRRLKGGCVVILSPIFLEWFFVIWWVILSFSWFLLKTLRCQQESITKFSFLFHLVSWIVPVVQIFIILLRHEVDIDDVT